MANKIMGEVNQIMLRVDKDKIKQKRKTRENRHIVKGKMREVNKMVWKNNKGWAELIDKEWWGGINGYTTDGNG